MDRDRETRLPLILLLFVPDGWPASVAATRRAPGESLLESRSRLILDRVIMKEGIGIIPAICHAVSAVSSAITVASRVCGKQEGKLHDQASVVSPTEEC